jgi:hydroxyacylglutathione hydrolase
MLTELQSHGCTPDSLKLVILSHGDFDHIGNAAYLQSAYAARLAMHGDDRGMAERGDMFANRKKPNLILRALLPIVSGFRASERFTPDILLSDGYEFSGFGLDARVISLPGHSKGSIGIITGDGELFCGDLFENLKGPTLNSLMDDPVAAEKSVKKIEGMQISTIYPGHGTAFTLESLRNSMAKKRSL